MVPQEPHHKGFQSQGGDAPLVQAGSGGIREGVPPARPCRVRVLVHEGEVWFRCGRKDIPHAETSDHSAKHLLQPNSIGLR